MEGLASLLPEPFWSRLIALGAELTAEYGATVPAEPHISYHLAYQYDAAALAAVAGLAAQCPPFSVTTSSLGLFGGTALTLFINVVRGPELSRLHQSLCDIVEPLTVDPHPANRYYLPLAWTPHITLGEVADAATLARAVAALARRDFGWRIEIDHIALLSDATERVTQQRRWALSGGLT